MKYKLVPVVASAVLLVACTHVPPESVSPIADVCRKYDMKVRVLDSYIACWKEGNQ